ncbi:hypothetical protein F2Q70_00012197 [Brassica cretica]|uniref:Uncharacterized protein n=1 Tax=Brassica cretica TaxID=69181 RepID=A0A8S9LZF2_BRACR|nr:hypothetical protein F2Q70_00012197 [Brassica cretica]
MAGDAETQISSTKRHGGGWITFPFMIATLLGLTIAAWGWLLNLIVYLIEEFNVKSIAAAQITNIFSGCICMVPAIGAIAADSFFGTIPVISVSAFVSLIGVSLLTLTAALDSLRPNPCDTASSLCQSPSKSQLGVLYTAITLASIGTGGTRFTLAAAGANQYEKTKDQGSFFNWFFFTTYLAGAISATAIVYSEDNVSWTFGFGLCVAANFFSFLVFILGRRFYKHDKPLGSPFTSLLRVILAAENLSISQGMYLCAIKNSQSLIGAPQLQLPRWWSGYASKQATSAALINVVNHGRTFLLNDFSLLFLQQQFRLKLAAGLGVRGGNLWSFLPNDGIVGLSVYSRTAGVSLTRLVCGFGVDSRLGMLRFSDSEAVGAVLLGFEGALSLGLLW